MKLYTFPAVFVWDGTAYTITFPDLPGCISQGGDLTSAKRMAQEALELYLCDMMDEGEAIPAPTLAEDVAMPNGGLLINAVAKLL